MGAATELRNKNLRGILWNWAPVAAKLPGKCGASDIDGVIERRGHFLFLEGKRPGERLPLGQLIMLKALAGLNDKVTVLVINGNRDTGEVESYNVVTPSGLQPPKSGAEFNRAIKRWWSRVNGGKQ